MIERVIIKNFRSIKTLELKLNEINALIGPNSSGKSNILTALNLIVGDIYPTNRSFGDSDFYLFDKSKEILIEIYFKTPISYQSYNIDGFRLSFDGNEINYVAIDQDGEILKYPNTKEIKVNNEMREKISMLYLSLDRQSYQQISYAQTKIYGKLLRYIASKIDKKDVDEFSKEIEHLYERIIYNKYLKNIEDLIKKYVKEQTGLEVNLRLSLIDPNIILKDLRPRIKDVNGLDVDIDEEGAGIQSSVIIGIARVYANVVKEPLILAIEEPELFMHPHACRHFYKILKNLSNNGIQIIYTTHERSFINISDYTSIILVKRDNDGTKTYKCSLFRDEDNKNLKILSKFDEELNEVFFADKVILVEGPSDKIACKLALEKLGLEIDKLNISIIDCGGNKNIIQILKILKDFNIDSYVILDRDPNNMTTESVIKEINTLIKEDKVFLQNPNLEKMLGIDEKLDKANALKILPEWFNSNSIPDIYKIIKNKIEG